MRTAFFIVFLTSLAFSQSKQLRGHTNSLTEKAEAVPATPDSAGVRLFRALEQAIRTSPGTLIEQLAGPSLNLSIPGMESGIVSSNQGGAIVAEFFRQHKIHEVAFTFRGTSDGNRFATGRLSTVARGAQEVFQVYAAFTSTESGWILSQFNIY